VSTFTQALIKAFGNILRTKFLSLWRRFYD